MFYVLHKFNILVPNLGYMYPYAEVQGVFDIKGRGKSSMTRLTEMLQ